MEQFYDENPKGYDERKGQSVSARLWLKIVLETIDSLPLGEKPWQILDAGGGRHGDPGAGLQIVVTTGATIQPSLPS